MVLTRTILLAGALKSCALPFVAAFANENAIIVNMPMPSASIYTHTYMDMVGTYTAR